MSGSDADPEEPEAEEDADEGEDEVDVDEEDEQDVEEEAIEYRVVRLHFPPYRQLIPIHKKREPESSPPTPPAPTAQTRLKIKIKLPASTPSESVGTVSRKSPSRGEHYSTNTQASRP